MRFVEIFDDNHLRAVDHAFGGLAALQACLPDDGGVAGGVDKAVSPHQNVAVTGGEFERGDPASVQMNVTQNGAE